MCCVVTDTVIPFLEGEEEKVFYKVVRFDRTPPYYYNTMDSVCYSAEAIVHSNRVSKNLTNSEKWSETVSKGIHVFLTLEGAMTACKNLVRWRGVDDDYFQVIKVSARKEDMVASGTWDGVVTFPVAVFMKVQVVD